MDCHKTEFHENPILDFYESVLKYSSLGYNPTKVTDTSNGDLTYVCGWSQLLVMTYEKGRFVLEDHAEAEEIFGHRGSSRFGFKHRMSLFKTYR